MAKNNKKQSEGGSLPKNNGLGEAEAKIESLQKELEASKGDYLKLLAEFNTFRRRTDEQKKEIVSNAAADTIKGLLPVLDDLERAMQLLETSADEAAKEGTKLIYTKLFAYLNSCGLEKIEAMGKKFDTDFHEAEAMVPVAEDEKKGMVYDVIQTGYLYGGKVLRFAKVAVGI